MNKTLVFVQDASRAFAKLPEDVRESLYRKLFLYGLMGQGDVKRLTGSGRLRLRDGDYRVVFDETGTTLTILTVAHRRDVYR